MGFGWLVVLVGGLQAVGAHESKPPSHCKRGEGYNRRSLQEKRVHQRHNIYMCNQQLAAMRQVLLKRLSVPNNVEAQPVWPEYKWF